MFRALLRLVLIVVIIAAAAAFFLGYRLGGDGVETPVSAKVPTVDTEKARETGAAIGQQVATGAAQAEQALAEGSLTAKIKAKMALDDTIDAKAIHVEFVKGVVTLTGTVRSSSERKRAVELARETKGVTSVMDRLLTAER